MAKVASSLPTNPVYITYDPPTSRVNEFVLMGAVCVIVMVIIAALIGYAIKDDDMNRVRLCAPNLAVQAVGGGIHCVAEAK